jgi:hypothetical protein
MLRNDGKFEIFTVEFLEKGVWLTSPWQKGNCQELTGELGSFDVDDARKHMLDIKKNNPDTKVRVIKTVIWQDTEIVWSI